MIISIIIKIITYIFIFIVFILPIFSVFAFGIFYSNLYLGKEKVRMQSLANALNLQFVESESPVLKKISDFNFLPQLKSKLVNFISSFVPWKIVGDLDGFSINIYKETRGSGKNSQTYTIIKLNPQEPLSFVLNIEKQGLLMGFAIKVFQMEDITIGDEKFDKSFIIKGNNPSLIKEYLLNRTIQNAINELMSFNDFQISHNEIHFEASGLIPDNEKYQQLIQKMSNAAKVLYQGFHSQF